MGGWRDGDGVTSAGFAGMRVSEVRRLAFFASAVAVRATSQGNINTNKALKELLPGILNHPTHTQLYAKSVCPISSLCRMGEGEIWQSMK